MPRSRFILPVAALALLLQACGSGGSTAGSSTGAAETRSMTLRLGTNDPADQSATASLIEEFARQVDDLSDGAMQVQPVFRAAGDPAPDAWDQAVARKVVGGDLEMGLIPSAAWDTEGVMSLRAVNAPFLIDSNELVDAIVTSDLTEDLMAGLDGIGVTGLALLPESLRHVFAFGGPLLSPADFAGHAIRAPRSATVYALFEALGATVDDLTGDKFDAAVAAGSVAGAESSYARAATLPGGNLTATGNITLFPKLNSLVINKATFDALSDTQQAVLRDAAKGTISFALANMPVDTASAQEFCAARGSIVLASDADLAALVDAAQPVYSDLERDGVTKDLIGRIRALKVKTPAAPAVASCDNGGVEQGAAPSSGTPAAVIPNGTYRRVATRATGVERGLDPAIVDELLGPDGEIAIELEIGDGRWTQYESRDNGGNEVGDFGTYTYDERGHWVTVSESGGCHGCVGVFDWNLANGVLSVTFAPGEDARPPDDAKLMSEGDYQQMPQPVP